MTEEILKYINEEMNVIASLPPMENMSRRRCMYYLRGLRIAVLTLEYAIDQNDEDFLSGDVVRTNNAIRNKLNEIAQILGVKEGEK